ncbi:MAG: hypothetical protein IJP33_00100 [Firmicutes bacterium]|nr:hypothetical protein [Bacillota bacterium]
MKPENINENAQQKRRKDALVSSIISTVILLCSATGMLLLSRFMLWGTIGSILLLILAMLDMGMLIPIWILYRKRLEEIKGGEEDAAAEY